MAKEKTNSKIVKSFRSRKNDVRLIKKDNIYKVMKVYPDINSERLSEELKVLEDCLSQGIPVPRVCHRTENTIILEYLKGDDCRTLFDDPKVDDYMIIDGVACWLSGFHVAFSERKRGDCILSNFILTDTGLYGIDFEESTLGDQMDDLGNMCTSILRMRPSFTDTRFSQVEYFIKKYFLERGISKVDITDHIADSLLYYGRYGSMGDEMNCWAQKIKKEGLDSIIERSLSKVVVQDTDPME